MENDNKKSASALREEAVLNFWKENKVFEKSLEKSNKKGIFKRRKDFIFYEGPPTANGKPGIHHLEARAFKDVIPRYKTMKGYYVRRKGGWDTHGLPVELQVEKKLGLNSKRAIEEYGIAKFNRECKQSVWEYLEYWNRFTERIGFWVDQENPYVTYHNEYIESVWNVIKEADKQKLLYKDYKVVPWCPRCGTALSSHELAQGYETVKDLSVYVKFKVIGQENTFILAWTTTPWTLPGNVALAIGENIDYVKINFNNENLILAKNRLSVIDGEYKILAGLKGNDLIGLGYEPLYPFTKNLIKGEEKNKLEKAYKVYPASFVTTEDGTGVVHTAVMYGQDDFVLGNEIGLPKHHLVGLDGKFLPGTEFLEGKFVRDEEVAVEIIKELAGRGLLLKKEKYEHTYPFCWRCKTALIYYARDSWYIRMSSLRDRLVKENKGINWEPSHIKEGRFGEWLREIKDWAISRERYWGSPLPVWQCEKCQKIEVIGSIVELKSKTKKSGNKYFVMRHGEAESNLSDKISCDPKDKNHLTEKGRKQVFDVSQKIKKENIDLIFCSDFVRTKETLEILKKEIGFSDKQIIYDPRLRELNAGSYNGKRWSEYPRLFDKGDGNSESLMDVKKRISAFLYEIESKYQNKKILIVGHESPLRLSFAFDYPDFDFKDLPDYRNKFPVLKNAEIRELDFVPMPHDENYELDLHKPYIDEVELICTHSTNSGQTCGGKLVRTKEVMDVWLDSGSMPFAQDHYPWNGKIKYPADFISEAIDQTRGWFYTLHAVGILMGRGKAFKNVICLGHILDANGKKMSKSLGNIIDPWVMIDKYGVDTLRLWMYGVNQPGESKNFDEKTVAELHNKVFNLLYNVLAFYELYRDKELENRKYKAGSRNVLDQWILARLDELNVRCANKLDNYKLLEPVRDIRLFIDDLSTWYLRRSRDRLKSGDIEAKRTLYHVLKTLTKIMAPFAPFAAEDIWQKLRTEGDIESVHLASWPKRRFKIFPFSKAKVLDKMETVRNIVTLGLEARQKAGLKVRQPLSMIEIIAENLSEQYLAIIQDELNVKKIEHVLKIKIGIQKVTLNTEITPELKEEGDCRELVRAIQDIRKKMGLTPSDKISLFVETDEAGKNLIQKFEEDIKKIVLATVIEFKANDGPASPHSVSGAGWEEIKIETLSFKIKLVS